MVAIVDGGGGGARRDCWRGGVLGAIVDRGPQAAA